MVDLDSAEVKPVGLAVRCLAGPSGLALNHDEKILFVAETCNNRILRFVLTNQGVYFFRYIHNIELVFTAHLMADMDQQHWLFPKQIYCMWLGSNSATSQILALFQWSTNQAPF